MKGRGTPENPTNRFESLALEPETTEEPSRVDTVYLKDSSRSILNRNTSPDVPIEASINPYRGCEHGCIYCYARPTHEYLGFSSGLDFETRILVKENAPELLRKALMSPAYEPKIVTMSGVTDCYQPVERRLQLTRRVLEVLADFGNPVWIITKNALVTRDIDVLKRLAATQACGVTLSLTSLDPDLCGKMEPRTSRPEARLRAIRELAAAGIPVTANIAPIIPALNESEIPALLKAAREAGAVSASYVLVRLPYQVKDLFESWLETHFPLKKSKVLSHIRDTRGGELNDSNFGTRMRGEGVYAEQVKAVFRLHYRRLGFPGHPELSTAGFHRPKDQMELF